MHGSEPLVFRHRRTTWEDWGPALGSLFVLFLCTVIFGWLLRPTNRSGTGDDRSPSGMALGILLGWAYVTIRLCAHSIKLILASRHTSVEVMDVSLRLTDWRGRTRELNWNDVSLNMGTSKVRIAAGDQMLMEVGAREFEDGYRLINELAQHVRAAQKAREEKATINITPFPPGYFGKPPKEQSPEP